MCRLFVFAKGDNATDDPDIDALKFKRGDVIDILEDGMSGGKEAEASGLFRIIEIPGLPASDLHSLLAGDPVEEGNLNYQRPRINRLDLDALEAGSASARPVVTTRARVLANRTIVATKPRSPTLRG